MWLVRSCILAFVASMLLAGVASAQASVLSTVSALPTASAAIAGSIAVSVDAGAIQALGSVSDNVANSFPSPVSITLTWDLHPSTGSVQVIGYFSDPAAAMTSGPVSIPSSWLRGRVLSAGTPGAPATFTAFTQNAVGGVGISGGSLSLATQPILGNSKTGTLTFNLELQLDLTGRVLTPGAYSGILNIRAVTQ
jgi:hypothetical protein